MVNLFSAGEGMIVIYPSQELGVFGVDPDIAEVDESFAIIAPVQYLINGSDFIEGELLFVFADKLRSN